jgi:hypothetical protein
MAATASGPDGQEIGAKKINYVMPVLAAIFKLLPTSSRLDLLCWLSA